MLPIASSNPVTIAYYKMIFNFMGDLVGLKGYNRPMPATFERDFRVRYYECDAFGHLNNANYLRYMQETAFDASASLGYDLKRYQAMNRLWWVRENEVEYLQPVYYSDVLRVKTWVADAQRATSLRVYEVTNLSTGVLVARGSTIWVYLDTKTGRPASIPDEVMLAYVPEGFPASQPERLPFPKAPPAPSGVFTTTRKVSWRDLDGQGHVNNVVYLEYAEECGWQALAAYGWQVDQLMAEGHAVLVRKNQIRYRQPAALGDELEISTYVSGVRHSTAMRHYFICRKNDGVLLAEIHALGVWVELATGRPKRFSTRFLESFGENIVY